MRLGSGQRRKLQGWVAPRGHRAAAGLIAILALALQALGPLLQPAAPAPEVRALLAALEIHCTAEGATSLPTDSPAAPRGQAPHCPICLVLHGAPALPGATATVLPPPTAIANAAFGGGTARIAAEPAARAAHRPRAPPAIV